MGHLPGRCAGVACRWRIGPGRHRPACGLCGDNPLTSSSWEDMITVLLSVFESQPVRSSEPRRVMTPGFLFFPVARGSRLRLAQQGDPTGDHPTRALLGSAIPQSASDNAPSNAFIIIVPCRTGLAADPTVAC